MTSTCMPRSAERSPAPGEPAPAPPIRFRGQDYRARKEFFGGTHRVVPPEETLERARPHFRRAGITRLGDITGLDVIGLPTVLAYRPNGKTLSSAGGKGFTTVAATVSAVMEGIELHHAENVRLPVRRASYQELAADGAVIPRAQLPLARHGLFRDHRPELWVEGWDLLGQHPVWVPFIGVSLVRHPAQKPLWGRPFVCDSNGLASANVLLEAMAAALYEVIERDAISSFKCAEHRGLLEPRRVRLETIRHPLVRQLIDQCQRAEIEPVIYDRTTDLEVPVYEAHIYDRYRRHTGVFGGYGCHLDPEIAMIRALTEAAQSRLVIIAGARDDIFRHEELSMKLADDDGAVERYERTPATLDARDRAAVTTSSFEGDLGVLLARLAGAGIGQVIAVDLTHEEIGLPVVRVIVPGLEGYMSQHYEPGPRARAFVAAAKARKGA